MAGTSTQITQNKQQGVLNTTIIKAAQYYVYALIDPNDKKIFYVGKGSKKRVWDHIKEAQKNLANGVNGSAKSNLIQKLLASGQNPDFILLRTGLTSDEAFEVEGMLIDLLRCTSFNCNAFSKLLSVQNGHHNAVKGIKSVTACQTVYSNNYAASTTVRNENILAISINNSYDIISNNVYAAVRSCWHVSLPRAKRAKYVVAVYLGVIVGIYENMKWSPATSFPNRYEFTANQVTSGPLYNALYNKLWPKQYPFGSGQPLRYTYN